MKRLTFFFAIIIGLGLVGSSILAAQAKPPDVTILTGNPMGGVKFEHKKHVEERKVACVTCHDPHRRAAVSVKVGCDGCHAKQAADFKGSRMEKSGVVCIDCHMPPATKSAESFGKYIGDIKTHIVKIDTRANASMFTADGKFATGITSLDFACLRCHGSRDKTWAMAQAKGIHTRGK